MAHFDWYFFLCAIIVAKLYREIATSGRCPSSQWHGSGKLVATDEQHDKSQFDFLWKFYRLLLIFARKSPGRFSWVSGNRTRIDGLGNRSSIHWTTGAASFPYAKVKDFFGIRQVRPIFICSNVTSAVWQETIRPPTPRRRPWGAWGAHRPDEH